MCNTEKLYFSSINDVNEDTEDENDETGQDSEL